MIEGIGNDCVGVAGRTFADNHTQSSGPPFRRLRSRNVIHRILPKRVRHLSPLRPSAILTRFAEEVKADRILCNFGTEAVTYSEAWSKLDMPLFVHFHGFDLTFDLRDPNGSGALVHDPGYKASIVELSKRAIFIANSNYSKNCLCEIGVPESRIRINYLGVEPASYQDVRKQARPNLLSVGRLIDCKGPDQTIRAFNRVREMGTDATLTLIGDGPMMGICQSLVASSAYASDIRLLGSQPYSEVQRNLNEANVFTMHSMRGIVTHQEEAFGVAFLDAMNAGLPVVTGRSGGITEIVKHGENGYLFEPGDLEQHAQYLCDLIEHEENAHKMGRSAWETVQANFTQAQANERLRHILGTV